MNKVSISLIAIGILSILSVVQSLDNGAALLPPLIVSTSKLGSQVTESSIRREIDLTVSSGLARIGFSYLLLDDCWQVLSMVI